MNDTILQRHQAVCQRIKNTRSSQDPQLLAVSKKHPASSVRALYQAGHRMFGESYVQEAIDKMEHLNDLSLEWHFIGPIQSNKTKLIAENFDWVQSVDRLKILQRLSRQRPASLSPLQILLQLKVGGEASKSGASVDELYIMYKQALALPRITIRGLMCIPPPSGDYKQQCGFFNQARAVFDNVHASDESFNVLSMGMSGDLEAAAACGSTMVRIGTDIFGART